MQGLRIGGCLLRHFGMHQFGFRIGEERGTAVVAEFHGEMMVEENDILDASFAQDGFDFARRIGCFILSAKQWPDDAVEGLILVLGFWRCELAAIFPEFLPGGWKMVGIEAWFGQTIRKDRLGRAPGVAVLHHAIHYPWLGLPDIA